MDDRIPAVDGECIHGIRRSRGQFEVGSHGEVLCGVRLGIPEPKASGHTGVPQTRGMGRVAFDDLAVGVGERPLAGGEDDRHARGQTEAVVERRGRGKIEKVDVVDDLAAFGLALRQFLIADDWSALAGKDTPLSHDGMQETDC